MLWEEGICGTGQRAVEMGGRSLSLHSLEKIRQRKKKGLGRLN